jgi:hypothetical protein
LFKTTLSNVTLQQPDVYNIITLFTISQWYNDTI